MFQKLANSEGVGLQGLDNLTWNDPKACLSSICLNGLGSLIIICSLKYINIKVYQVITTNLLSSSESTCC